MGNIHKRFTSEQVKVLLRGYWIGQLLRRLWESVNPRSLFFCESIATIQMHSLLLIREPPQPTVVDNFSRECLMIEVGQKIRGEDVTRVMDRLKETRGVPRSIYVDNGPEFISKELDKWAYENKVTLDFSRPG